MGMAQPQEAQWREPAAQPAAQAQRAQQAEFEWKEPEKEEEPETITFGSPDQRSSPVLSPDESPKRVVGVDDDGPEVMWDMERGQVVTTEDPVISSTVKEPDSEMNTEGGVWVDGFFISREDLGANSGC
mmetsp:Transcript_98898/g.282791  ORF Transcript_98898/g.282791 Transcript_98898/m.282791 type:complete len:129 (-) Transcript_98898:115-501(-)